MLPLLSVHGFAEAFITVCLNWLKVTKFCCKPTQADPCQTRRVPRQRCDNAYCTFVFFKSLVQYARLPRSPCQWLIRNFKTTLLQVTSCHLLVFFPGHWSMFAPKKAWTFANFSWPAYKICCEFAVTLTAWAIHLGAEKLKTQWCASKHFLVWTKNSVGRSLENIHFYFLKVAWSTNILANHEIINHQIQCVLIALLALPHLLVRLDKIECPQRCHSTLNLYIVRVLFFTSNLKTEWSVGRSHIHQILLPPSSDWLSRCKRWIERAKKDSKSLKNDPDTDTTLRSMEMVDFRQSPQQVLRALWDASYEKAQAKSTSPNLDFQNLKGAIFCFKTIHCVRPKKLN